ncbi:MAG: hypothetical protein JKY13_00895, partial [Gammaproteobacteria bacterium]|nr:hypothetical protein [Gammaproteobacteria bacterium]
MKKKHFLYSFKKLPLLRRVFVLILSFIILLDITATLVLRNKELNNIENYGIQTMSMVINLVVRIQHEKSFTTQNKKNYIATIIAWLNSQYLSVSLSKKPYYTTQINPSSLPKNFSEKNYDEVLYLKLQEISKGSKENLKLSYQTVNNRWINISFHADNYFLEFTPFLIAIELLILIIILSYIWSIERFLKPWELIRKTAQRLGVTVKKKHLPLYGPSVVKEATHIMNNMVKRIDQLINERVATIAALSHDIRTPLTRAKLYTQLLADNEDIKKKLDRQLDQVEYLLNETLSYAKQDYQV